jgi:hypothetical protein
LIWQLGCYPYTVWPLRVRWGYCDAALSNDGTGHDINLDLLLQRGVKMLKTQAYEQSLRMLMEMLGTEASKSLVHTLTVILVHCPEGS